MLLLYIKYAIKVKKVINIGQVTVYDTVTGLSVLLIISKLI